MITSAASPAPGGQGFAKGQDPENVDANGVENVVKKALEVMPPFERTEEPFLQADDFSSWKSNDDTIMGGSSSSEVSVLEGTSGECANVVLHAKIASVNAVLKLVIGCSGRVEG